MKRVVGKKSPAIADGLSHEARARTRAATVSLPDKGGQGVLVHGGFVLTAAHCIEWSGDGEMVREDHNLVRVKPRTSAAFKLNVCALDPLSDIAVLERPDAQEFDEDADAFDAFCRGSRPVPIRIDDLGLDISVPVHVLSHEGSWIRAEATRYGMRVGWSIVLKARSDIKAGTSGGPVVDDAGYLMGIVSVAMGTDGLSRDGTMPRPHLALPVWLWLEIDAAQRESALEGIA
jgi:hypothetical protein